MLMGAIGIIPIPINDETVTIPNPMGFPIAFATVSFLGLCARSKRADLQIIRC